MDPLAVLALGLRGWTSPAPHRSGMEL